MYTPLNRKLEPSEIAVFSQAQIRNLAKSDLVTIVRFAGLPFLTAADIARLPQLGRDALLKLGFVAREFCRSQSTSTRCSALSE